MHLPIFVLRIPACFPNNTQFHIVLRKIWLLYLFSNNTLCDCNNNVLRSLDLIVGCQAACQMMITGRSVY